MEPCPVGQSLFQFFHQVQGILDGALGKGMVLPSEGMTVVAGELGAYLGGGSVFRVPESFEASFAARHGAVKKKEDRSLGCNVVGSGHGEVAAEFHAVQPGLVPLELMLF